MPYYSANNINVRLGSFDLNSTVTTKPEIRHSEAVTAVLKYQEDQYKLAETVNAFREITVHEDPADTTTAVRFLGGKCGNCPEYGYDVDQCARDGKHNASVEGRFYLVMVDSAGDQKSKAERLKERLFPKCDESVNESEPMRPARVHETNGKHRTQSKACNVSRQTLANTILKLKVGRANLERIIAQRKHKPRGLCLTVRFNTDSFTPQPFAKSLIRMDVKVDVYHNGEYAGCSFVPSRAKQVSNKEDLVHRFHGRKVCRTGEKPWILIPAPDAIEEVEQETDGLATVRWEAIAANIRKEAQKHGPSELRKYLEDLAALPLPEQIAKRQSQAGLQFGIIDVVLTLGRGKKHGPSDGYLLEPCNMDIGTLSTNFKKWSDTLSGSEKGVVSSGTAFECQPASLKRSAPSVEDGPKKRRRPYQPRFQKVDALCPPTAEEQFGAMLDAARNEANIGGKDLPKTRGQRAGMRPTQEPPATPCTPERSKRGLQAVQPLKRPLVNYSPSTQASSPLSDLPSLATQEHHSVFSPSPSTQALASSPMKLQPSEQKALGNLLPAPTPPATPLKPVRRRGDLDMSSWVPGPVNTNSVTFYSNDDKLRQTKSERTGCFEESSIMFGVRYVVF